MLREIAKNRGKTVAQIAINWSLCKGFLVIVGTRTPQQARENIGAADFVLSPAEIDEIDRTSKKVKKFVKNPQECD